MWLKIVTIAFVVMAVKGNHDVPGFPGFHRKMSENVESLGYEIMYGDEEFTVVNEVVKGMEDRNALKMKDEKRIKNTIKPLPAEDVKCLMSVDRYCSKEMGQMKSVLIQALKEDCAKCSKKEKEKAGHVIASMMAHDPAAWKLFLTRCAILLSEKKKSRVKRDRPIYKPVGEPEIVDHIVYRKAFPGVKVKVSRTRMKRVK